MMCRRCRRDQSITTKEDPNLCRAHLRHFVDTAKANEFRVDCWRAEQHTAARVGGFSRVVSLVERLLVDPDAVVRPIVVACADCDTISDRGAFSVEVFAFVGAREYRDHLKFGIDAPEQEIVDRVDASMREIAVGVLMDGVRWAS